MSITGNTNKYKRLLTNTMIFAIGTFGSKLLVYFMLPIYSNALSPEEYGVTDLIAQTANLLLPLVYLGITSAVIRFGLDKSYRKDTVLTTALVCLAFGFAVMLLFWPLVNRIEIIGQYTPLIYLYVLMSALRSIYSCFVRTLNKLRLFAYDGIQSTLLTIGFTLLFLLVFDMGIVGYILAIIAADFLSALFLFFAADLKRFINLHALNKSIASAMLRYSLPLIPASLFWWVTNVSDRYMVTYIINEAENGLYSMSSKIPTLINLLSTIFMEAWQISAISEKDSPNRARFFSKVFNAYASLLFCAASFLILTCQIFTSVLLDKAYYGSWIYIPVLLVATVFCCFCNFLNSIYMVERKSLLSLLTVMAGAVSNILLNLLFIPHYGAFGAAIATLLSYVVVFVLRYVTVRRMIRIHVNFYRFGITVGIISLQIVLTLSQVSLWGLWVGLLFLLLAVLNMHAIVATIVQFVQNRRKKSAS